MNTHHHELLQAIRALSGEPSQHTLSDTYLGNAHPKYPIRVPVLRSIAREWTNTHPTLSVTAFTTLLSALTNAKSSTEKCMAGLLLDLAPPERCTFDPALFDQWLNPLVGWVEVDSLCTGAYSRRYLPLYWDRWQPVIGTLWTSDQPEKKRAALVLFCSPVSAARLPELAAQAFIIIQGLMHEKNTLITKAVSWLLRSLIKHHRQEVTDFLDINRELLPAIAVRETLQKLTTGRKGRQKA